LIGLSPTTRHLLRRLRRRLDPSPTWEAEQADGTTVAVPPTHEFRHNLGTVLNGMVRHAFALLEFREWTRHADPLDPGSWPHSAQAAAPRFDALWRLEK
jgi:hypothetical protein